MGAGITAESYTFLAICRYLSIQERSNTSFWSIFSFLRSLVSRVSNTSGGYFFSRRFTDGWLPTALTAHLLVASIPAGWVLLSFYARRSSSVECRRQISREAVYVQLTPYWLTNIDFFPQLRNTLSSLLALSRRSNFPTVPTRRAAVSPTSCSPSRTALAKPSRS